MFLLVTDVIWELVEKIMNVRLKSSRPSGQGHLSNVLGGTVNTNHPVSLGSLRHERFCIFVLTERFCVFVFTERFFIFVLTERFCIYVFTERFCIFVFTERF